MWLHHLSYHDVDIAGAVELRDALSAKYGPDMPPTLTFDHPTVSAIAAHLAEILQPSEHAVDQVDKVFAPNSPYYN